MPYQEIFYAQVVCQISKIWKRATSSEWVQYLLVSVVVKVYKHREPFYLYLYLNETLYTVIRKTLMGHFYDKSKGKMGRQKIWNKLKFLDGIFLDWIRIDFSTNGLHRTLKKAYF